MFGTCIKFDRSKGYGFLLPTDDPTLPDVFCHFSVIEPTTLWRRRFLLPGLRIQFDVEFDAADIGHERPRAKNVRVIPPVVIAIQRSAPTPGERS
jgi:cold shock CspA family protein